VCRSILDMAMSLSNQVHQTKAVALTPGNQIAAPNDRRVAIKFVCIQARQVFIDTKPDLNDPLATLQLNSGFTNEVEFNVVENGGLVRSEFWGFAIGAPTGVTVVETICEFDYYKVFEAELCALINGLRG
jgi:hypothetical protein